VLRYYVDEESEKSLKCSIQRKKQVFFNKRVNAYLRMRKTQITNVSFYGMNFKDLTV